MAGFSVFSYSMRFALLLSVVFSVAAVVAGGMAYDSLSAELRARLYDDARLSAVGLASLLDSDGSENLINQLRTRATIDRDNSILYYFAAPGAAPVGSMAIPTPFEGQRELLAGTDFTIVSHKGQNDGEVYFAYGLRTSEGVIVVARNNQWISDSQEVLQQSLGLSLGAALLISLIISIVLAKRNAERITGLNVVLEAASQGNLGARFNDTGLLRDDISQVAAGVNGMLGQLENNVERLQQVSADIAHDLRAPLTRLRLKLEPQTGRADLPMETQVAIKQSLEAIEDIAATFDSILKLAQLESGNARLEQKKIDLNQLLFSLHDMLGPVAEDMGHTLILHSPTRPVQVQGDKNLLTQAVINLIDNALLYCPAPAQVEISTRKERDRAFVIISDNGPGIPRAERDKVTRRFYRLDASRNRPGAGLGLSLVVAIAKRHGGEVHILDNKPGLRIELSFPLSRAG